MQTGSRLICSKSWVDRPLNLLKVLGGQATGQGPLTLTILIPTLHVLTMSSCFRNNEQTVYGIYSELTRNVPISIRSIENPWSWSIGKTEPQTRLCNNQGGNMAILIFNFNTRECIKSKEPETSHYFQVFSSIFWKRVLLHLRYTLNMGLIPGPRKFAQTVTLFVWI